MSLFKTQISKNCIFTHQHLKKYIELMTLFTFLVIFPILLIIHKHFPNREKSQSFFILPCWQPLTPTTIAQKDSVELFIWQSPSISRVSATFTLRNLTKHDIQGSTLSERGGKLPRFLKCWSIIYLPSKYHICWLDKFCFTVPSTDGFRNTFVMLSEKEIMWS